MASCSSSYSSAPKGGWTYDVFLSFRGEDTRYTFVDHLYTALVERGLHVYKDDKTLHRGNQVSQELMKGIEESRFAVVVLSKNYANSSWCLEELAKIMECKDQMGHKVLPVFYHVDPSDVRGQKHDFATAFEQHEDKFKGDEMDKVNKWRNALTSVANLAGYHISALSGGESSVITEIVQKILCGIQTRGFEDNLVDIDSRIDELYSLLEMEAATDEVRVVGICGMGGIGKSTIADALFRRIAYKFEGSSFVNDVRENSCSNRDICALQEQILQDILGTQQAFRIRRPEDGAEKIRTRLCNKKVLLALDDVDCVKQLEFLAARHEWFGPGSRIIITTRNEHVLSQAHVNGKYKPALLHVNKAIELFSRYAFRRNSPPQGYEGLSTRAVSYTGCLPLALKVLGSYMHERDIQVWESALDRLGKTPNKDIFQTLKLSFDDLDEYEQKIFLDIACFFKGREVEDVKRIFDSFDFNPVIGITVLIEKSLITVSNKRLCMHDLIQEMGWHIVHRNFPNSRLWQLEKISDVINKKTKPKAVEGIVAHHSKLNRFDKKLGFNDDDVHIIMRDVQVMNERITGYSVNVSESTRMFWLFDDKKLCFNADVFESMKNIRLLDVCQKFTSAEPTVLPYDLRWLCWNWYPFSSVPLVDMHRLVGIEMQYGHIEYLWKGQEVMPNLKFLNLHGSEFLKIFPDVTQAPNIERLILSQCRNLARVHVSLGFLKKLVHLDMSDCKQLKRLPIRLEMESLDTLILDRCSKLEKLPVSIRGLTKLRFMSLVECVSLDYIPDSIHELHNLQNLHLHDCPKLRNLPEFGSMEKLQDLRLGFTEKCTENIMNLSTNFHALTNLCSLKKLDLSTRQIGEDDFPEDLHAFSSLEELILFGNLKLIHLPESISHLSRLRHLDLDTCYSIVDLHGLPSGIQVLNLTNCHSLRKIGDVSIEHECLYKIWLPGCEMLLKDDENQRYLDKMLTQSFLMKWAAADCCLSIIIPERKIPSWLQEQHGNQIGLKLPPSWQTQIMGFAICVVIRGLVQVLFPTINFSFKEAGILVPESEFDSNKASEEGVETENMNIGYIPLSSFQQRLDGFEIGDLTRIVEGHLVISVEARGFGARVVRCGAKVVYKKDVESIQEIKPSISCCWKWDLTYWSRTSVMCMDQPGPWPSPRV